jgi:hypothetical protein
MHIAAVKSPPDRRAKAVKSGTAARCRAILSEGDPEQSDDGDNQEISRRHLLRSKVFRSSLGDIIRLLGNKFEGFG